MSIVASTIETNASLNMGHQNHLTTSKNGYDTASSDEEEFHENIHHHHNGSPVNHNNDLEDTYAHEPIDKHSQVSSSSYDQANNQLDQSNANCTDLEDDNKLINEDIEDCDEYNEYPSQVCANN